MSWKQVKLFNPSNGGSTAGECLQNDREGWGIAAKYATAYQAWQHTQQHKDKNFPAGVAVPAFFSYGYEGEQEGHIGTLLANGEFWSDGHTYPTLNAFQADHTPKYLGWGESVNDVRVVQAVTTVAALKPGYYTVVKGDTLSKIAAKYRLTLLAIERLNPSIKNPNLISVGEKIRVK